ncbi:RuvA C-terminal domain-containing protein [Shewanella sp. SP2S2-6]|uniref:RuvA C-terminal domain-containing protein n=1 Tax=Shewanella sp. SP2S2-6 TaxID=3063540 RepID=UPI00289097D0|nr:RuvA C-terminal domain-containing protein [Shewanella sp. SP2S2-6]MDT3294305.1 RuvA C-terminal domain-containing protein [Shewanella sp. SP2S2-6]
MNDIDNSRYEDLDWAESENLIEESTILQLINDSEVEPNLFNTFDWLNNMYERIQEPTTELLSEKLANLSAVTPEYRGKDFDTSDRTIELNEIETLEKQYNKIAEREEWRIPYKKHFRQDNPLEIFLQDISYGSYPPPEVMMMLAKCFSLYLIAEGKLSLEEVFFGRQVKRAGNYSMRKARSSNFKEFHYQVEHNKQFAIKSSTSFNLQDFALDYLRKCEKNETDCPIVDFTEANIESFITSYYRWKKQYLNESKSIIDFKETQNDAIHALISLGYPSSKAKEVVLKQSNQRLTAEEIIKKAIISLLE